MKLISWNVNGLRACIQKGFLDFFMKLMQIFSVFRNPSCRRDRSTFLCPVIFPTGIMPRKKVTPAQRFSQKKSL